MNAAVWEISSTSTTAATTLCQGSGKIAYPKMPIPAYTADQSRQAGRLVTANRRQSSPISAAASSTGTRPPGSRRDTSSTEICRSLSFLLMRSMRSWSRSQRRRRASCSPPHRQIAYMARSPT
jgi:hypothetical protein